MLKNKVGCQDFLTQCTPDQTEEEGEANKGPIPFMVFSNRGHSHENKDQGLTDTAQHLHEILYGCVGLLGNILLHILIHGHGTSCYPAKLKVKAFSLFFKPTHLKRTLLQCSARKDSLQYWSSLK